METWSGEFAFVAMGSPLKVALVITVFAGLRNRFFLKMRQMPGP